MQPTHQDKFRIEFLRNWHDDLLEGARVLGVAIALVCKGNIDRKARPLTVPHFVRGSCAWVEAASIPERHDG
eukprot:scaffold168163_cov32-Tisochrysis_lutea.AAC.4